MRVLVTGAAGFVGSRVVASFAGRADVAALLRPGTSSRRLEDAGRPHLIEADLADRGALRAALAAFRPDACVHLAWYAEPGRYLDAVENLDCLRQSLELVELLAEAGCRRLVAAGTCFEYALDDVRGPLREDAQTGPRSLYASTKLAFQLAGSARARQVGISFAWARLFYLYGPGEDHRRLLPAVIEALLDGREFPAGEGGQVRDYLHVDDVAAGLAALATAGCEGTFNISSGEPVRIRELLETAAELVGGRDRIRFGASPRREWDPPYICGNSDSLRSATGWTPRANLREGIAATIDWWRAHRPSTNEVTR